MGNQLTPNKIQITVNIQENKKTNTREVNTNFSQIQK